VNPETVAYVRYRAALARENLDVAKLALTAGHLRSAVNRLYYACFYTWRLSFRPMFLQSVA